MKTGKSDLLKNFYALIEQIRKEMSGPEVASLLLEGRVHELLPDWENEKSRQIQLLEAIALLHRDFIKQGISYGWCDKILEQVLVLSGSEFGFISELFHQEDGTPYIKSHGMTNIAWDHDTREFYENHVEKGLEFFNINSIWGHAITTGKPYVSSNPDQDPHRGGYPKEQGHPPLTSFLGLPIKDSTKAVVGIIGLANNPNGYSSELIEFLSPFVTTYGLLIEKDKITKRDKLNQMALVAAKRQTEINEARLRVSEQKLKRIISAKNKFISIIAHDLRSPFNTLLGFSDILVRELEENNTENVNHYANILHDGLNRLFNLSSNLLEWAINQVEGTNLKLENFDLRTHLNEVIECYTFDAENKQIVIEHNLKTTTQVCADKNMLGTILRNLISNAVKFSGQGGKISVCVISDDSGTTISVKDNGVGIPPDRMKKLFKIEESISTEGTNSEKGTGLGLILCKEFVDKHGGKIWAESETEKGTAFHFTVPVQSGAKPGPECPVPNAVSDLPGSL